MRLIQLLCAVCGSNLAGLTLLYIVLPCVANVVLCWLRGLTSILINEDFIIINENVSHDLWFHTARKNEETNEKVNIFTSISTDFYKSLRGPPLPHALLVPFPPLPFVLSPSISIFLTSVPFPLPSFLLPLSPARESGRALGAPHSESRRRPAPNDFWCILTLKLYTFITWTMTYFTRATMCQRGVALALCLYVRLSVTSRSSIKTAERIKLLFGIEATLDIAYWYGMEFGYVQTVNVADVSAFYTRAHRLSQKLST